MNWCWFVLIFTKCFCSQKSILVSIIIFFEDDNWIVFFIVCFLLISKFLFFSFNELLDIIIREVVLTCDEIWKLLCKKISWERNAEIESFVINVLTEKSLTNKSFWNRSFVNDAFLDSDSLTKWFLNLLNVDSIVLDVWYSSI
jgi:hypothetical protein